MKFWAFWYIVCLVLENTPIKTGETWETEIRVVACKTRWEISAFGTQITHAKWQPASGALGWWVIKSRANRNWTFSKFDFWPRKPINSNSNHFLSLHFFSSMAKCRKLTPSSSCCHFLPLEKLQACITFISTDGIRYREVRWARELLSFS